MPGLLATTPTKAKGKNVLLFFTLFLAQQKRGQTSVAMSGESTERVSAITMISP